jgi:hypothetical protein
MTAQPHQLVRPWSLLAGWVGGRKLGDSLITRSFDNYFTVYPSPRFFKIMLDLRGEAAIYFHPLLQILFLLALYRLSRAWDPIVQYSTVCQIPYHHPLSCCTRPIRNSFIDFGIHRVRSTPHILPVSRETRSSRIIYTPYNSEPGVT